jgi:hypothetical protein
LDDGAERVSQKTMPDYLIFEDPHAAYAWRYHRQPPADYKLLVALLLGSKCICCGEVHLENLSLDHLIPLSKTETTREKKLWLRIWRDGMQPKNIQLMCKCCNGHGKGSKPECSFKIIARHILHMMKQAA